MKSVVVAALALAACSDPAATSPDASSPDAPAGATCTGACRTTAVTATFGSVQRSLDHGFYGITKTSSSATLHVEAYKGGGAGCPTMSSPTTEYTLVLGDVPIPSGTMAITSRGNLLDFAGDLLGGPVGAAASAVTLTPVATNVCPACVGMPAPSDPDGLIALDLSLTFSAGTITGHLFATHCDELDEQAP